MANIPVTHRANSAAAPGAPAPRDEPLFYPAPRDEPLFYEDPVAKQHADDSSSLAPSRADEVARTLRSPTMWLLFLITLATLVGLVFMAFRLHPVDAGQVRGPADEAAPNAPLDYKAPRAPGLAAPR